MSTNLRRRLESLEAALGSGRCDCERRPLLVRFANHFGEFTDRESTAFDSENSLFGDPKVMSPRAFSCAKHGEVGPKEVVIQFIAAVDGRPAPGYRKCHEVNLA
jgi:hypothetical protein